MSTQTFFSNRDALLVAVPFLLLMFLALFGVGDRIGHGKGKLKSKPGRAGCGMDVHGEPIVCDPDGQLHNPASRSRTIGGIR